MIIRLLYWIFRSISLEDRHNAVMDIVDSWALSVSPRAYVARISLLLIYIIPGVGITIGAVLFLNWLPTVYSEVLPPQIATTINALTVIFVIGFLILELGAYGHYYHDILKTQRPEYWSGRIDHYSPAVQRGAGFVFFLLVALCLTAPVLFAFSYNIEFPLVGRVFVFLSSSMFLSILLYTAVYRSGADGIFGDARWCSGVYTAASLYFLYRYAIGGEESILGTQIFVGLGLLFFIWIFIKALRRVREQLNQNMVQISEAGRWKTLICVVPLLALFVVFAWLTFVAEPFARCDALISVGSKNQDAITYCLFQDPRILAGPIVGSGLLVILTPFLGRIGVTLGNIPLAFRD